MLRHRRVNLAGLFNCSAVATERNPPENGAVIACGQWRAMLRHRRVKLAGLFNCSAVATERNPPLGSRVVALLMEGIR